MKKILCFIISLTFALSLFAACDNGSGDKTSAGTSGKNENTSFVSADADFTLLSAVLNGKSITSEFSYYDVTFRPDGTMSVLINRDGVTTRRNSTYTYEKGKITETNGFSGTTFRYLVDVDGTLVTSYEDFDGTAEIVLKKKETADLIKEVDFQSVLFGESPEDTKMYNYCPAVIVDKDEDGNDVMHVWYCTNKDSGVIVDHIGYRTGVKQANGKWIFSDEKIVLSPTEGTWDAAHTCDPAVIKGEFKYHGKTYSYLMAFLGCTSLDYQKNETGIAVAESIDGPWVKIDEVNPIVPWYDDGDIEVEEAKYQSYKGTTSIYWGTGMPSLLSVDGKGEVIMFYQSTLRGTGIRRIDLSDVANPIVKYTVSISSGGILNSQNVACRIGIPDFSYDRESGRLYVVSVTNERNPADVTLTRVNSHSMVAYIDGLSSMEAVAETLKNGSYRWNMVGYVGPSQTGWERNHNPALVRGEYGELPSSDKVDVIVSTGHNSWPNENIFTYRLFGWSFEIGK